MGEFVVQSVCICVRGLLRFSVYLRISFVFGWRLGRCRWLYLEMWCGICVFVGLLQIVGFHGQWWLCTCHIKESLGNVFTWILS